MPRSTTTPLTRRALLRLGGGTLSLVGLGFLAACGTTPTPQAIGLAPSVTAAPQATAPPSATGPTASAPQTATAIMRVAAATATPQGTAIPSPMVSPTTAAAVTSAVAVTATRTPAAPPAAAATMTLPLFDGIPQGRTADGFPFLGNPDAAVTLIDYSDFL